MIVLGSGSPRRAALLEQLAIPFTVRVADIDESVRPGEDPVAYAKRMASEKLAALTPSDALVLTADTVVIHRGEVLAKPAGVREAAGMIRRLAGETHVVATAFALGREGELERGVVLTEVTFRALEEEVVERYAASGEGADKAGGYGIQGVAGAFVERLSGCYFNVVGLPLSAVTEALQRHRALDGWPHEATA